MALILNEKFQKLPKRKSDRSTVIDESKVLVKNYLRREKQIVIKRTYGYEKQWRRICNECESPLGYQCRPYEEKCKPGNGTRYLFYVYPKGIINTIGECRVAKEVAKMGIEIEKNE